MNHRIRRRLVDGVLIGIPLIAMFIFILGPLYWTLSTSLKLERHIQHRPAFYWPPEPTFEHFVWSWEAANFAVYFRNSVIVSALSMIFVVIISVLVSYPLTRFKFKGKNLTLLAMLGTQFLPTSMMLIPLFLIFIQIGLINTLTCVIISIVTFQFPYNTVLMTGFMSGIPVEIEEAAMIDGCSRIQSIIYVVVPILIPGIVAAGTFAFISAWREFLFTLMFIQRNELLTISVGLTRMLGEFRTAFGPIAAGCVIAMIPPIALFAYIQKFLITGLSAGAVKG